jgi:hypothetical protein
MSKPVTTYQPRLVADNHIDLDEFTSRLLHLDNYTVSIDEAMRYWGKARQTVINAINQGRLIAVKKNDGKSKTAGFWIIERESIENLWGKR